MSLTEKRRSRTRHDFLLTFFDEKSGYATKEVNGFILVKQWNGNTNSWNVAIYTPKAFRNRETFVKNLYQGKQETSY